MKRCKKCLEEIHLKPDGTEVDNREHAVECSKRKQKHGWICDHEATWNSKKKVKDNDTIWLERPLDATGCKRIKLNEIKEKKKRR